MKEIKLTQGQFALVDDEWLDYLSQWKWYAVYSPHTKSFYASRTEHPDKNKSITIQMHRTILSAPGGVDVDHKNHNTLDNQLDNLRLCSNGQNQHNRAIQKNNTSGYKGVSLQKGKWKAQIRVNGHRVYLGYYNTKEEAAIAHDKAAQKHHGEFAYLNFPETTE